MSFLFPRTSRVHFELSNQCNYSYLHPKCPAHHQKEILVLSSKIVRDILKTLAEEEYCGMISWHNYNEPLLDPRLMEFTRLARTLMSKSFIRLWTNGRYLTKEILEHLIDAGVSKIFITAYTQAEKDRLKKVFSDCRLQLLCQFMSGSLDNRMSASRVPQKKYTGCKAPLRNILIYCTGEIGLCCKDVTREVTFSNLNQGTFRQNFEKALPKMLQAQEQLQKTQKFNPCKVCLGGR